MSRPRSEFKDMLKSVPGATVYGDVTGNVDMNYPAIRFEKDDEEVVYGDNLPYYITDGYLVTVMEADPNTPIAKLVRQLPWCRFSRYFEQNQLHHTVYKIFF